VGRAYSCWILNWWCITWPVDFKRLNEKDCSPSCPTLSMVVLYTDVRLDNWSTPMGDRLPQCNSRLWRHLSPQVRPRQYPVASDSPTSISSICIWRSCCPQFISREEIFRANMLWVSERRIFRMTYGRVNDNGIWRAGTIMTFIGCKTN